MKEGFTGHQCPKCGGNLFLTRDFYSWFEQCLQCAYIVYTDVVYEKGRGAGNARPDEAIKAE